MCHLSACGFVTQNVVLSKKRSADRSSVLLHGSRRRGSTPTWSRRFIRDYSTRRYPDYDPEVTNLGPRSKPGARGRGRESKGVQRVHPTDPYESNILEVGPPGAVDFLFSVEVMCLQLGLTGLHRYSTRTT